MEDSQPNINDVPQKIFGTFISELRKTQIDITVVDQLEQAIADNHISEQQLREALAFKTPKDDQDQQS
ncbi:hypothetical protein ACQKCH_11245 [Nubsella zeaxanthinifaciens]|uniref:hypothetical protein n=1 Tax=Nubsella zeaxanthinifaciens TaxID=392412 RepID=UPI003D0505DB